MDNYRDCWALNRELYFKECLMVKNREKTGKKLVPLICNPCQLTLLSLVKQVEDFNLEVSTHLHNINPDHAITKLDVKIDILKPRKEGISTAIEGIANHLCEFNPHTNALLMANRKDNATNIALISRRFINSFPDDLKPHKVEMKKMNDNEIEWGELRGEIWDSRIIVCTSKDEAVARGHDYDLIHYSEIAHFPSPDAISAANQSTSPRGFYMFKETTANGFDPSFYPSWQNAKWFPEVQRFWRRWKRLPENWNGEFKFFWGWWQDPEYQIWATEEEVEYIMNNLDDIELDLKKRLNLTPHQFKWRRHNIKTKCSEQAKMEPTDFFKQEMPSFPEEAFIATGNALFNQSNLRLMESRSDNRNPKWHGWIVEIDRDCVLRANSSSEYEKSNLVVWEKSKKNRQYIIGSDTAEGREQGDFSVAIVFERLDHESLLEVACYRGKTSPTEFAFIIKHLSDAYNSAFVIPEANAPGNVTCQILHELGVNMYRRRNEELVGDHSIDNAWMPGFKTHRGNKALIIERLAEAIRMQRIVLCSPSVIHEHMQFANINGQYKAPPGENDDTVIASALAWFGHITPTAAPPMIIIPDPLEISKEPGGRIAELVRKKIKRDEKINRLKKKLALQRRPASWDILR